MRLSKISAALTAAVSTTVVLALSGCGSSGQGQGGMPPQTVTVVTLKNSSVELQRELPGLVSARQVAEVRPQVGGIVKRVLFTEGGQVHAGQQLYELDDAVYRVAQRSADANRMSAETALDTARRSADRGTELVKAHMISVQDNDNLQTALHKAEADLATAQAAADSARINLDYAHISAPITGRIGKSAVTQGALVVANQPDALATVQKLDTVYVDLTQSSGEWLQLQQELAAGGKGGNGSEVHIKLEDGSDYPLAGQLQFSDVTVQPGTGSFLLRVLVPNPKATLLPGMYVRANIVEGTLANALLAPQTGITRDPKGNATAMVVGKDNKVELRNVTASRAVGDQWLVTGGLSAGDRVIVEGLQKIQPGMPVQPAELGANAAEPAAK
ncbi:MAG: efflux RND transporter periplasmic adaptor subunit [Steroidobacteraceae bacterium]